MKVQVIVAHPDDAEYSAGGTMRKYSRAGHEVRVVSLTNGDAGHPTQRGPQLIERRNRESWAASNIGEFRYQILNHHDAQLVPSIALRDEIIGHIRSFEPDVIFTHRPCDYHPDHRTTGAVVQDAAYLLTVPAVLPRVPAIQRVPLIVFFEDSFLKPLPFEPDVAVSIDDTVEDKIRMLDCHVSQFYEWLPFNQGRMGEVPHDADARREWLGEQVRARAKATADRFRAMLKVLYGGRAGSKVQHAEAFEACEYGRPMTADARDEFFPFF
jgi:N-acetylglucosamine malate deacetylase 1